MSVNIGSSQVEGRLYGKQTDLGVANFPLLGRAFGDVVPLVRAYAVVKSAAARANYLAGVLDEARRDAIVEACQEILDGHHTHQFPTALVHGGGGTTANMNVNEVIATRASSLSGVVVHPNDHVNASQSTNDTYPTAMALALLELVEAPIAALRDLGDTFERKAVEFADVLHLGRTCLQDAVTLTAGDTHRAQAAAIHRVADGLARAAGGLNAVPIGATAVGTGVGAPNTFAALCVRELAALTGYPITASRNRFDSLAHLDAYSEIAAAGTRAAVTMAKIAADIRLLSSGPYGGFGDMTIPAVQAGSSIMPAKINPVIPEFVMQLSYRVRGANQTVECAVAAGELELNVMEPVIVDSVMRIFDDLTAAAHTFSVRCVEGVAWNGVHRERNLEGALNQWVELSAKSGYESATNALHQVADVHDDRVACDDDRPLDPSGPLRQP